MVTTSRCGCQGNSCACLLAGGDGIVVTGSGTIDDPYVIDGSGAIDISSALVFLDTPTVDFTVTGSGTNLDPRVVQAEAVLALDDLTDVEAPDPTDNYVLTWNGTAWVPAPPATVDPGTIVVADPITGDGTAGNPLTWDNTGYVRRNVVSDTPPGTNDAIFIGSFESTAQPSLVLQRDVGGIDMQSVLYATSASDGISNTAITTTKDGASESRLQIVGDGRVLMQTYPDSPTPAASRPLPFANASGRVSIPVVQSGGGTEVVAVTYPASRFTQAPVVVVSTSNGRLIPTVAAGAGATGFSFRAWNFFESDTGSPSTGHWIALQTDL